MFVEPWDWIPDVAKAAGEQWDAQDVQRWVRVVERLGRLGVETMKPLDGARDGVAASGGRIAGSGIGSIQMFEPDVLSALEEYIALLEHSALPRLPD